MFRNRFLILVGVGFLAASAAWADDIGYVDCSSHSDGIQVFAKPRKTPDVLATVPCGERFTVLVYGFVFSQVQTRDGRVGFVYSNMIAIDHNATSLQQSGSFQAASSRTKVPSASPAAAVTPNPPVAQPQTVAAQPAPKQTVDPAPNVPQPVSSAATIAQASPPEPASSPSGAPSLDPAPASLPPATSAPETPAVLTQPATPAPAQPEPAPVQPAPAQPASAPDPAPAPPSTIAEPAAPVHQPEPPAASQPQPAPPEPAPAPIRPKAERAASWERPNSAIRKPTLFEFYGGYAFARMGASGGGTFSNLNGGMGSIGLTLRPWLQIVADSTYNYMTATGSKTILYGNHFGARYFYRNRNRWGATPFVEGLVGGSRTDVTITGTGGYTSSVNCISYKAGGGLDIRPTRHWEIRLIDVDYYRTAFGTGLHQNNYWVTTGVVLHLFGGSR